MNGTSDRISSLSDDILIHILSFVSAKDAVQTCIISKRWRHVWAFVPVLKFLSHEFWVGDSDVDDRKFDRFVNGVFENRGQSRLDTHIYEGDFEYSSVEPSMEWLDRAALLRPEVIHVLIHGSDGVTIPDSVFSCASLQNLELSFLTNRIGAKSITLPSLKTMKLHLLTLDDDFAQNLFLGCPSLESLNLEDCTLFISEFSSNVLKELTLHECWQLVHIQICSPSLVSLFMISSMNSIRIISLVNMASLVNADINLYGIDEGVDDDDLTDTSVLCGLSNATSLKLDLDDYLDSQEQWENDIPKCAMFKNLKSLEIGSADIINDFKLVACFLEHSPVLQELTLNLRLHKHIVMVACFLEHSPVLQELTLNLRLHKSTGDAEEEPLQHVLFKLEYLETVKIFFLKNDKLVTKLISLLGRHVKTIGMLLSPKVVEFPHSHFMSFLWCIILIRYWAPSVHFCPIVMSMLKL